MLTHGMPVSPMMSVWQAYLQTHWGFFLISGLHCTAGRQWAGLCHTGLRHTVIAYSIQKKKKKVLTIVLLHVF